MSNFRKSPAARRSELNEKKREGALDVFMEAEDADFGYLRSQTISEGLNNIKQRISSVKVEPKITQKESVVYTEDKTTKLKELGDRSYNIYRTEIKPKEEKEKEVPCTIASRADAKARMNELIKIRNGGDVGKSSPAGLAGSGNVSSGEGSRAVGLYPTSLTIEDYETYINDIFEEITAVDEPREDIKINSKLPQIMEEVVSSVIEELEEGLLQLEDGSWQSIDTLMRSICKEHNITPKELHKEFKKTHGMIPDDWLKEQRQVNETCGWFPLDEVVRINKVGMVYDVTFIFRGVSQRLKFFWPEIIRPTKITMQKAVEKLYPTAKLILFYPSMDQGNNSMVLLAPMREFYDPLQADEWGQMSDEATLIYEEICTEEGNPLTPPYVVDENVYEVVVEDYDTGEGVAIQFEEIGEPGSGKHFCKEVNCWDGYKKKGMKKKGDKMVNNCVKEEGPDLSVGRGEKQSVEAGGGLTAKGRAKYNRATGSNLKAPVTSDNPGPKDAGRRKSFCARSRSWDGERGIAARKRWKC